MDEKGSQLIQLVQLPVIEEHLKSLKSEIDRITENATSIVCDEESLSTVKSVRADLNKKFADMEERRKAVKSAVMAPYEDFERVYDECVRIPFKTADAALKSKIGAVEDEQKQRCEEGLREYFQELCDAHRIDWLTFDDAGIKVDMASAKAKTPNRLRKKLAEFVVKVNEDINLIDGMEHSDEIMVEYRRTLNAAQSIQTVLERRQRIDQERESKESRLAVKVIEEEAIEKVETAQKEFLEPPKEEDTEIYQCVFTIHTTLSKLRKLKNFMNEEGIKYE